MYRQRRVCSVSDDDTWSSGVGPEAVVDSNELYGQALVDSNEIYGQALVDSKELYGQAVVDSNELKGLASRQIEQWG